MAEFKITTQDGAEYKITAPDEKTAMEAFQRSQGGGQQQPAQEQPSTLMDNLRAIPSGLRRGGEMFAGMLGDAPTLALEGGLWLAGKAGAPQKEIDKARQDWARDNPLPTTEDVRSVTDPLLGPSYEAKTRSGKMTQRAMEFIPAALGGPGSLGRRVVTQGVVPGVMSEAAGQLTEGTAFEPYARVAGALAGPFAASAARRMVTPFPASPDRLRQADTLAQEGVQVTAGQRTGSDRLRYTESELGGTAGQRRMEQQGEQFTAAVLRRAGIQANRATPEVIDQAFTRIGNDFDNLAAHNILIPDGQMVRDLRLTRAYYNSLVPQSQRAPAVDEVLHDIVGLHGRLDGAQYQALRSRLDRMARATRTDPQLSEALSGIRNALDGAMERSVAVTNPNDLGAWREARRQYRNMLVIEQAATGAGENTAAGLISPSQLRSATARQNRRGYARGRGDFADLARAGEAVMRPLPNSGTAGRTAARSLGASLPALIGAGAGAPMGILGSVAGAAAGAAVPALAGRALLSGPGQAYLSNQLLANPQLNPALAALLPGLLAAYQQRPAIGDGTGQ